MRVLTFVLLLGGLLLWTAAPAAASPAESVSGNRGAGHPGRPTCAVEEGEASNSCGRGLQLSGRISNGTLLLQWEGSAARGFDIFYSSAPFAGYVKIDQSERNRYREPLAHVETDRINDYYQVREKGGAEVSNRLGVFTFSLYG